MSNTNRAISRVRRSLGKKRMYNDPLYVAGQKGAGIRKPVYQDERPVNEIREASRRGIDSATLASIPGMVTDEDGIWRFRPMRPVPGRRGHL